VDRLLDRTNAFDPAEGYLADLIRASEPVPVVPARKQRLLNGILLRQQVRRVSPSRLLRPVFVVGVLSLAGAATAAATIGRRAWQERTLRPSAAVHSALTVGSVSAARRTRPVRAVVAVAETDADDAPVIAPDAVATARPVRRSKPALRARVSSQRALTTRAAKSEDPSLMVDAIQALRNDHEPARASRLLADYLARYPRGALAEEAIALSIEAAAANHSPAAAGFAERYLRQYPTGRFRETAEKALGR
jgi:hypothetical protein